MTAPKKILVLERDEVVMVLISHILTRQSYVVHTTGAVPEAERLLLENDYDAILMDLKIPDGGIDYIRRIHESRPALLPKIIVVTGAVNEIPNLAMLPVHSVVKKPFEVNSLVETVRDCVR